MRTRCYILVQLFLTLVVVGLGVMWYLTTRIGDDLNFAVPYLPYIYGDADFPGFAPWMECVNHHFNFTNGRLADKLMPLFLLLPRWLFALLMVGCVVVIYRLCCRIAVGRIYNHPLRATMLAVCFMLAFPWYMRPFLTCMSVNYVIVFTAALWLIIKYFSHDGQKLKSLGWKIILVIVAFITAASHEGLVYLLAPGFLLFAIQHRRSINSTQLLILSGGIAGAIFIICNPGFWVRLRTSPSYINIPDFIHCLKLIVPVIIYLICYTITLMSNKLRFNDKDAGIYNMIAIFGLLNIISLFINSETATLFEWTILLSITGVFALLRKYCPTFLLHRAAIGLTCAGACFVLVMTGIAIRCEAVYRNNYYNVVELYMKSADGVVYYDEERMPEYAPLAMNMHSRRAVSDIYLQWRLDVSISVLPTVLKDFNPNEAKPCNPALELYNYRGCIVSPDTSTYDYHKGDYYIDYYDSQGTQKADYANVYKLPARDGSQWAYVSPIFRLWYRCPDVGQINYIGG